MPSPTLISALDQVAWNILEQTKDRLREQMHQVDKEQEVVASRAFVTVLSEGEWRIDDDERLTPADSKAERALASLLQTALHLGYHDGFSISDGALVIWGRIDDGGLMLFWCNKSYRVTPEDFAQTMKRLNVSIDLRAFLAKSREAALQQARGVIASATARLAELEALVVPGVVTE